MLGPWVRRMMAPRGRGIVRHVARRVRRLPRAVVALGGNALLRRGEPLEAANQARAAREAAAILAPRGRAIELVITHGNGPQVGLLALMGDAYTGTAPYPLDVLGSETEGQIGYVLELELDNAIDHQDTVAVLTLRRRRRARPGVRRAVQVHRPRLHRSRRARWPPARLAVSPTATAGGASCPRPSRARIVELGAIRATRRRGLPGGLRRRRRRAGASQDGDGRQRGVEAVIDKDLASRCWPTTSASTRSCWRPTSTPSTTAMARPSSAPSCARPRPALRGHDFPAGSMGPKVEAVCRFVERTGGRAVIGGLGEMVAAARRAGRDPGAARRRRTGSTGRRRADDGVHVDRRSGRCAGCSSTAPAWSTRG